MKRCWIIFLWLLMGCFPAPMAAVSLNVVRPTPAEGLAMVAGFTFVVGTVIPADSTVTCNGVACEVDADGAFLGFVPIVLLKEEWILEPQKICDATFSFVATHGAETTQVTIPVMSPRSPSAALPAEELYEKPQMIRTTTRDQWIGLEGERLGQVVYIRRGSVLKAKAGGPKSFRCDLTPDIEVSIPLMDAEKLAEKIPQTWCAYLISPQEDTRVEITDLVNSKRVPIFSGALNEWGCDFQATANQIALKHKHSPSNAAILKEILSKSAPPKLSVLEGMRICLDPGHHADKGAVGPRGFEERKSTLLISREVARILQAEGAIVDFTREEEPLVLRDRHPRMRELRPDMVLSIHNNSVGDGQDPRLKRGTQTFYLHPWSKPLAESVHHAILAAMGTADRGCIRRNLYIPRFLECPTILIEPEYIILPDQEKKFMDPEYRTRLAQAIVDGVKHYVRGDNRQ